MSDGESSGKSTIAKGTKLSGRVKSDSPIAVYGTVDGDIDAPSLEVFEGGVVSGRVKVERLESSGEIAGHIEAKEVALGGKVRDETSIRANRIEVRLSSDGDSPIGLTIGNARVEVGDMPTSGGNGGDAGNG